MSEWYGSTVVIDQDVVPNEPFPQDVQAFFKAYAKALKETHESEKEEPNA